MQTARLRRAPLTVFALLALGGIAAAYTCVIDISTGDDLKFSGDIYARARVLATAENEGAGIGFAEYEARVWGDDVHGPNATGAAALLNQETIDLTWTPDGEPDGVYSWSVDYDFVPSGGGQTWVSGGSTIAAMYTIKVNAFTVTVGGNDESPASNLWPSMGDQFIDNTLPRGAPGSSSVNGNGQTDDGPPPDMDVSVGHNVNAWWTGNNPDDTPPAPTAHHQAAIMYTAKCTLTVPEPTR